MDGQNPRLSDYEQEQIKAIAEWKREEPSIASRALGFAITPVSWLVQKLVPEAAIMGALSISNYAAVWMTDTADIVREAGVEKLIDLRSKDLRLSDSLADGVHNWAIGMAVVEGAATGSIGVFGAPIDVPAIITLSLRTIHKIGVCYGYECKNPADEQFAYSILSASGANSIEEKVAALATLTSIEVTLMKQTWKAMAEKAAETQFSKESAIIAI